MDKIFTLEQANACLPLLEELLDEMQEVRKMILASAPQTETVLARASGNGGNKKAGEHLLLLQRFQAAQATFQEIGCELKDLDLGLVDFPSYREGQLVYLCWKRGEPRVEFWHPIEAGFAGRQPL